MKTFTGFPLFHKKSNLPYKKHCIHLFLTAVKNYLASLEEASYEKPQA